MTSTTAGASGLVRALFLGSAPKAAFLPFPEPDAETRETADEIFAMVSAWAAETIDPAAIDRAAEIPVEVRDGLAELGLLGLIVPEEFGGAGMGQFAYSRLMEAVAHRCASTVTVIGGHMGLAMKPVLLFGTDEQKAHWLPQFASGERLGSFALTEAGAGSDAGGLRTSAEELPDGSWKLSGTKVMITNAGYAGVFAVFARTPDPEQPDLPLAERPISCFYVPAELPGVTVAPEEDKMGLKGSSTCEVAFDEVVVPADHLIGPRGKGFKVALNTLNTGRHGLAACCIGQAKLAAELAYKQAGERVQFGRPIAEFGLIREMLAGMTADIYAMEAGTHLAAGLMDRGETDYLLESAACKIFATERLWTLANDSLQVAGGWGFMKEFPFERIVRDARINLIFEGTNQILRTLMAGQGLKPLLQAGAPEPEERATVADFDARLAAVAGQVLEQVEALGSATAELLETKGKGLFFDQPAQARISEASVALYTALAVLSRATSQLTELDGQAAEARVEVATLAARRRLRAARASLALLVDPDSDLEGRIVERAY
ncbi:MAG: acyl-CoA dehydrogenase family protein [Planctomycetota bacterium]|nr:acyl-CoA dehydrogenase family protein [Planctomycetota bacterium]